MRLAALTCLQQLAKADCRALHPFWIVLLPVYNPLQTKYNHATLMDAIVRDPVPKVGTPTPKECKPRCLVGTLDRRGSSRMQC